MLDESGKNIGGHGESKAPVKDKSVLLDEISHGKMGKLMNRGIVKWGTRVVLSILALGGIYGLGQQINNTSAVDSQDLKSEQTQQITPTAQSQQLVQK